MKFATVATEVRTGHEIWLTHGPMVDAMRASYALPGIFSPVLVGDRWLVDGALVNPVPVSAARALGAEIVIAANLSSDVFTHSTTIYSHGPTSGVSVSVMPEAVPEPEPRKRGIGKFFSAERTMKREFFGGGGRPGISSVMVDAFNIMQDRITRARLAGDPPDLLISPRVGKIGWFDFHRADDLIVHGAARPNAPSNRSRRRSTSWRRRRRATPSRRWKRPRRNSGTKLLPEMDRFAQDSVKQVTPS